MWDELKSCAPDLPSSLHCKFHEALLAQLDLGGSAKVLSRTSTCSTSTPSSISRCSSTESFTSRSVTGCDQHLSSPSANSNEFMQHLHDAMILSGLADFIPLARSWCAENGAVFVEEVLDQLDELCDFLKPRGGFPPTQLRRFRAALLAQQVGSG